MMLRGRRRTLLPHRFETYCAAVAPSGMSINSLETMPLSLLAGRNEIELARKRCVGCVGKEVNRRRRVVAEAAPNAEIALPELVVVKRRCGGVADCARSVRPADEDEAEGDQVCGTEARPHYVIRPSGERLVEGDCAVCPHSCYCCGRRGYAQGVQRSIIYLTRSPRQPCENGFTVARRIRDERVECFSRIERERRLIEEKNFPRRRGKRCTHVERRDLGEKRTPQ